MNAVDEYILKSIKLRIWSGFDLLGNAFLKLETKGILCLHNAGYTLSDGHYEAVEALGVHPKGKLALL